MTRSLVGLALVSGLVLVPSLEAGADVRRLALVAGANRGASERVPLRYAIADAERFAGVMTRLGGLAPDDCVTLKDPTRRSFLDALALVRSRAEGARQEGSRVEVILYYSGHADEAGLMLGREALSYRELREAMQGMAADVGITVLDACASGVITRLKGGRLRPAFLTDDSMRMQGHAFLTSSSENEAAQESERLQGSFFTHALVSGLRGAADTSGDGRVTLGEAYQFAFQETLAQTTTTQGGAQHPAYDIRMSGTGDVVMTDVRQATAGLVLGPDFDGRFFVRDGKRRLVAELYKPAGRRAEIAVEPGTYEVQYEEEKKLYAARSSWRRASGGRLCERTSGRPAGLPRGSADPIPSPIPSPSLSRGAHGSRCLSVEASPPWKARSSPTVRAWSTGSGRASLSRASSPTPTSTPPEAYRARRTRSSIHPSAFRLESAGTPLPSSGAASVRSSGAPSGPSLFTRRTTTRAEARSRTPTGPCRPGSALASTVTWGATSPSSFAEDGTFAPRRSRGGPTASPSASPSAEREPGSGPPSRPSRAPACHGWPDAASSTRPIRDAPAPWAASIAATTRS